MGHRPYATLLLDSIDRVSFLVADEARSVPASEFVPFECSGMYPLAKTHFLRAHGTPQRPVVFTVSTADLPPAPPPFPLAWYEWREEKNFIQTGVAVITHDLARPDANHPAPFPDNIDEAARRTDMVEAGVRWLQFLACVVRPVGSRDVIVPPYVYVVALTPEGKYHSSETIIHGQVVRSDLVEQTPLVTGIDAPTVRDLSLAGATILALFFQSLLGCRNVEREEIEPPAALSRKRVRHGRLPLVRYHTLRIRVPGTKTYYEPHPSHSGEAPVPVGLHLVRGHFKTYTAERPLLGRAVGRFYWPPMLRGSLRAGSVGKHYEEVPS